MYVGFGTDIMYAVWMIALCVIGSIGFYLYHKFTGKGIKTSTASSVALYGFMGVIAGLLLVYATQGGTAIGKYDVIPLALAWGAGWQSIIGKFLGWNETRTAAKATAATAVKTDAAKEIIKDVTAEVVKEIEKKVDEKPAEPVKTN